MTPMHDPAHRIRLIERSLRCFVFGFLSLIPLIGLGPAVLAVSLHFKVWSESGTEWNPAIRYATAGFCLAWIGIAISVGGIGLFLKLVLNRYGF